MYHMGVEGIGGKKREKRKTKNTEVERNREKRMRKVWTERELECERKTKGRKLRNEIR